MSSYAVYNYYETIHLNYYQLMLTIRSTLHGYEKAKANQKQQNKCFLCEQKV